MIRELALRWLGAWIALFSAIVELLCVSLWRPEWYSTYLIWLLGWQCRNAEAAVTAEVVRTATEHLECQLAAERAAWHKACLPEGDNWAGTRPNEYKYLRRPDYERLTSDNPGGALLDRLQMAEDFAREAEAERDRLRAIVEQIREAAEAKPQAAKE